MIETVGKGRIIGGSTALKGQFPYQVSLRTGSQHSHYCGGFIITNRWIGTAGQLAMISIKFIIKYLIVLAHCTIGRTPKGVVAVVGSVSRTFDGTKVALSALFMHPNYNVRKL